MSSKASSSATQRPGLDPATVHVINPFPGLRPFEEDEADLFFGRERHIEDLLKKLTQKRLSAVVGTSGCGKSSLVLAGVLPRLHRGYAGQNGPCWRIVRMRPGSDPIGNLATALQTMRERGEHDDYQQYRQASENDTRWSRFELRPSPMKAISALDRDLLRIQLERSEEALSDVTRGLKLDRDENLLLIVDQFEELFRFSQLAMEGQRDTAAAFVRLFLRGCAQQSLPIYVMLTMRSDFLGECAQFPGLAEALNEGQYLVPLLTRDQRAETICGPIGVAGAAISTALVQRMLNDVGDDTDRLPVLQHALMRTFDIATNCRSADTATRSQYDVRLELAHYVTAGGVQGALSDHANEAYRAIETRLGEKGKRITELMFRCLTDRGERGQGVRRPCRVDQVLAVTDTDLATLAEVTEQFVGHHRGFLVQQPPGPLMNETALDISHESLMRNWDRLKAWTAAEIAFGRQLKALDETRREYVEGAKSLLRDPELSLALKWKKAQHPTASAAARYGVDLSEVEDFLAKSSGADWLRKVLLRVGVSSVIAGSSIFGLVVHQQQVRIEGSAAQARNAQADAKTAMLVQLARNAGERSPLAVAFLRETVQTASERSDAWHDIARRAALLDWGLELGGHTGATNSAAFSNDDRRVVTSSDDATARIWDSESGRLLQELEGHTGTVTDASFSFDGRRVVTASEDNSARIWDSDSGRMLRELRGHKEGLVSAKFSRGAGEVLTASRDGTARLWDSESGKLKFALREHTEPVLAAALSSDGSRVATASQDGTARIWDGATGRRLFVLSGHTAPVNAVTFSENGRRVLTASDDYSARLWDSENGRVFVELKGHSARVRNAKFSRDGHRVATASLDGVARIWDSESGNLLRELKGHVGGVNTVEFSRDGRYLLTASGDRTARLWDCESSRVLVEFKGHNAVVNTATFSQDGRRVTTSSEDNSAKVWDIGRSVATEYPGHTDRVQTAAFSTNGWRILSASADKTARVWDAADGKPIAELKGHSVPVSGAIFSRDGQLVLTGAAGSPTAVTWNATKMRWVLSARDNSARVWNSENGVQLAALLGHYAAIRGAGFSVDGGRVVTASADGTAIIWDRVSGGRIATLVGHAGAVNTAAFAPDGKRVITASEDGTARIWNSENGGLILELAGHTGPIHSVMFDANGQRVVTASLDSTARIWDTETGQALVELAGHSGPVVSAAFSANGQRVVTASADHTARVWDSDMGVSLAELRGHSSRVNSAVFSADGRLVLTASRDTSAIVWDSESGSVVERLNGHTGSVNGARFNADGTRIVTASVDHSVGLWTVSGRAVRFLGHGVARSRAVLRDVDGHQVAELWDEAALVWRDVRTFFWRELERCLRATERMDLMKETTEQAHRGYEACRNTIEVCRNGSFDECERTVISNYPPPHP